MCKMDIQTIEKDFMEDLRAFCKTQGVSVSYCSNTALTDVIFKFRKNGLTYGMGFTLSHITCMPRQVLTHMLHDKIKELCDKAPCAAKEVIAPYEG